MICWEIHLPQVHSSLHTWPLQCCFQQGTNITTWKHSYETPQVLVLYIYRTQTWSSLALYWAYPRLAPSQWETSLQRNAVSHWLGTTLDSVLLYMCYYLTVQIWCIPRVVNVLFQYHVYKHKQNSNYKNFPFSHKILLSTWKPPVMTKLSSSTPSHFRNSIGTTK